MAEFSGANTATVKMKVPVTADGNIAQAGDTVKGNKVITLGGIKSTATLAQAAAVFGAIVGTIGGGTYDSLSAVKTITQGVAE